MTMTLSYTRLRAEQLVTAAGGSLVCALPCRRVGLMDKRQKNADGKYSREVQSATLQLGMPYVSVEKPKQAHRVARAAAPRTAIRACAARGCPPPASLLPPLLPPPSSGGWHSGSA